MKRTDLFLLYVAVILFFAVRLCHAQVGQDPPLSFLESEVVRLNTEIAETKASGDIHTVKHQLDLLYHELGNVEFQIGDYYGAIPDPTPQPVTPWVGAYPVTFVPQMGGSKGDYFVDFGNPAVVTHTVSTSGNWSSVAASIPANARVLIPSGVTVTMNVTPAVRYESIAVKGILKFSRTVSSTLKVGTIMVYEGGEFDMGKTGDPIPYGVNHAVLFNGIQNTINDPDQMQVGLLAVGGKVSVMGYYECDATLKLPTPVAKGATTVPLTPGACWHVGDKLWLGDSNPAYLAEWFRNPEQGELVTVTALNPNSVTISAPTKNAHSGWVSHETRNLSFISDFDPNSFPKTPAGLQERLSRQGHIIFAGNTDAMFKGASLRNLGRTLVNRLHDTIRVNGVIVQVGTNQRGRYDLHWHHAMMPGVESHCIHWQDPASILSGTTVQYQRWIKWATTSHNTHLDVTSSVYHDYGGSAIVTERGTETGTFSGNLIFRSFITNGGEGNEDYKRFPHRMIWDGINTAVGGTGDPNNDMGFAGYAIWNRSPLVEVTDNAFIGSFFEAYSLQVENPFGDMASVTLKPMPGRPAEYVGTPLDLRSIKPRKLSGFDTSVNNEGFAMWGASGPLYEVSDSTFYQHNGYPTLSGGHIHPQKIKISNSKFTLRPGLTTGIGGAIGGFTDWVKEMELQGCTFPGYPLPAALPMPVVDAAGNPVTPLPPLQATGPGTGTTPTHGSVGKVLVIP